MESLVKNPVRCNPMGMSFAANAKGDQMALWFSFCGLSFLE